MAFFIILLALCGLGDAFLIPDGFRLNEYPAAKELFDKLGSLTVQELADYAEAHPNHAPHLRPAKTTPNPFSETIGKRDDLLDELNILDDPKPLYDSIKEETNADVAKHKDYEFIKKDNGDYVFHPRILKKK